MTIKTIIKLALLPFIVISCDYYSNKLVLINKTNRPISYEATQRDTILNTQNLAEYYLRVQIHPDDSARVDAMGRNGWDTLVARSINKKLNLFVIQIDTIEKYHDMHYIVSKRKYKRYEYSLQYLKEHNWEITIK